MTSRRLTLSGDARSDALSAAFAAIRRENRVTEAFSDEVEREAAAACAPGAWEATARDCTSLPMFTIDPPGSMDLDQAIYLERTPAAVAGAAQGFRLRYAIADVASFVAPGGRVDAEARSRGCTIYLPDGRVCATKKKDGPCLLIFTNVAGTWKLSGFEGDLMGCIEQIGHLVDIGADETCHHYIPVDFR